MLSLNQFRSIWVRSAVGPVSYVITASDQQSAVPAISAPTHGCWRIVFCITPCMQQSTLNRVILRSHTWRTGRLPTTCLWIDQSRLKSYLLHRSSISIPSPAVHGFRRVDSIKKFGDVPDLQQKIRTLRQRWPSADLLEGGIMCTNFVCHAHAETTRSSRPTGSSSSSTQVISRPSYDSTAWIEGLRKCGIQLGTSGSFREPLMWSWLPCSFERNTQIHMSIRIRPKQWVCFLSGYLSPLCQTNPNSGCSFD